MQQKSHNLKSINYSLKKQGVILAYLFGSQAKGFTHKDSDVDIAVLFDKKINTEKYFDKSLKLTDVFEELFPGKERVITVLNEAPPLLKQEVLSGGKLLYSIDEDQKTKFYINTIENMKTQSI